MALLHETEVKLAIDPDLRTDLLRRLRTISGIDGTEIKQRDEYYDTLTEDLRSADLTVRLRETNGVVQIAFKTPRVSIAAGMHTRLEVEVRVAGHREAEADLARKGLRRTALIEKRRLEFEILSASVALDSLPYVGSFVEVEGKDRAHVDAVIATIGLNAAHVVSENYTELLELKFQELGLPGRPSLVASFDGEALISKG